MSSHSKISSMDDRLRNLAFYDQRIKSLDQDSDEEEDEYSDEYNHLDQILQQYRWNSQYPDTVELRRLLDDVTDDEKMRLLKRHGTLWRAAMRGHSEMISTILSSLPQHQRLDVLLVGGRRYITPLHCAAFWGNTDSVKAILSPLTSDQQLTLLSMRDCGRTPADYASMRGNEETERVLRGYEQRATHQTGLTSLREYSTGPALDWYPVLNDPTDGGNPEQEIRKLKQLLEKQDDQLQQQGSLVQQLKKRHKKTCNNLSALSAKHQKLCDKQEFEKKQTDMVTQRIASDVSRVEKIAAENSQSFVQIEHQVKEHSRTLADNNSQEIPNLKRKFCEMREAHDYLDSEVRQLERSQATLENNQAGQANTLADQANTLADQANTLADQANSLAVFDAITTYNNGILHLDVQRANERIDRLESRL